MNKKVITDEVKSYVYNVLIDKPACRDCDKRLVVAVWGRYLKDQGVSLKQLSFIEFCKDIVGLECMPSPESITRARRVIQKEESLLRGEKYQERQARAEQAKEELGSKSLKEQYENQQTDLSF